MENSKRPTIKKLLIFSVGAIVLTIFLFFIDEGYYNFKWMSGSGNWAAFLMYFVAIVSGQYLIFYLLFRNKQLSWYHYLIILIGGTILGIILVIIFLGSINS